MLQGAIRCFPTSFYLEAFAPTPAVPGTITEPVRWTLIGHF